jgi:hypothetical protein
MRRHVPDRDGAKRPQRAPLAAAAALATLTIAGASEAQYVPADILSLTIDLYLSATPIHTIFTRQLTFTDASGDVVSVDVDFTRVSGLHYQGDASAPGLTALRTLDNPGNRSHWDSMAFTNQGGTTALSIDSMTVTIEYDHDDPWLSPIVLATAESKSLPAGNGSFTLSGQIGRRDAVMAELGISESTFYSFPTALRFMVYDLGKSGSDDSSTEANPKYGNDLNLCSETISWYYHEYGEHLATEDFEAVHVHTQMHDAFLEAGSLYCYHAGAGEWVLKDDEYDWVTSGSAFVTYHPQPGDYLDRRDRPAFGSIPAQPGHAMMMLDWDSATGKALVIDGPAPVAMREVDVDGQENDPVKPTDFCVGRIPSND